MCETVCMAAIACSFTVTLIYGFSVIFQLPSWDGCLQLLVSFLLCAQYNTNC